MTNSRLYKYPREFSARTGQFPNKELYKTLMQEELWEVMTAGSREELLKELADCLYVFLGYLYSAGAHIREDRRKECQEDPMCQSYSATIANLVYLHGFIDVFDEAVERVHQNNLGRVTQDDGTVKRREDGKILKNPNAPKIDLSDLV